jgi:hypothetical protein
MTRDQNSLPNHGHPATPYIPRARTKPQATRKINLGYAALRMAALGRTARMASAAVELSADARLSVPGVCFVK